LTHGDTDHIGFAERLRQGNGIAVRVHELDAARARGEVKKPSDWGRIKVGPLLRFLWYGARHGGLRIRPVREVMTFADGDVLDLPGSPRIIHIPGHTPGSVAVHVPPMDALFVGDAMTTGNVLTGERGPGRRHSRSTRTLRWPRWPNWRPCRPPGCCPGTERHGAAK
jgi:glyoxylase-like metal-dependent hydrolase (beta-lactamase superfamily II)